MNQNTTIPKESDAAKQETGGDRMRRFVMLFVEPAQDYWKWAITEGGEVVDSGKSLTITEIAEVARRQWIADVFIDEGYRTHEVRKIAEENRWHCVRSRSHRKRDGIAELLDWACQQNDERRLGAANAVASQIKSNRKNGI